MQLVGDSARAATATVKAQQGQPVPDIRHLALRAVRKWAERQALKKGQPELWTVFRKVDAACRRHARARRKQGWVGVCASIDRSRDGTKAWRQLKCLLMVPLPFNQVMSLAVHLSIQAVDMAEQLADQFSAKDIAQLPAAPPLAALQYPDTCHHPGWTAAEVQELCCEPIRKHELEAALAGSKRRSAAGANGVTFQMLRNLYGAGRQHLLEYYNDVWSSGVLPESWRTVFVAPILKPRKKAMALSSYRPVSLTSAPCKVLEKVALERLEWIAGQLEFFPEQLTGFRRHRCTADSISDVVITLEDAKAVVTWPCCSCWTFVTAFLTGRTFEVRVGKEASKSRDITTGVPQGSVLSPFLFNLAMTGLPASLPTGTRFAAPCSVYADDVALWVRAPRRSIPAIRTSLQAALDAVSTYLSGIGLKVSATKTEALLIHPLAAARRYVKQLRVGNRNLPWKLTVKYLGLTIDHRLTWVPAAKVACTQVRGVQGAISKLQQRGYGCSTKLALRLNQVSASSVLLYAFPLVALTPARRLDLEGHNMRAVRVILGLPRLPTPCCRRQNASGAPSQPAEVTDGWSLCTLPPDGPGPASPGGPCTIHHQLPEVYLYLDGVTKRRTPAAALQQATVSKLQQQLAGRLQVFTDGSVMPDGSAVATCVIPSRAISRQCRLPFSASSMAAELAGLHLVADLLAEDVPAQPVAVLCDSKAALQTLANHHRAHGESPAGNEEADTLAKAAHQLGTPITKAVAVRDYSQARIKKLLASVHPDQRVANGRGPRRLPEAGLTRRERADLLRLWTRCVWTAAHCYLKGCCASPACSCCGDPDTLEHLLCDCSTSMELHGTHEHGTYENYFTRPDLAGNGQVRASTSADTKRGAMSRDAYEDIAQNLTDKMKSTLTPANDGVFSKNCLGVVTDKGM
ncbi:uncharacterized protein LOC142775335 [Rhipicephalus microplus]|uniref:uncharacterized protein LOC142775335 n=1 Tax=Rhipicephalus microplus TaxID=6941 RepID=UPI003F6A70A6